MNRPLVTALVIGIVSGCGSPGSPSSPSPAVTPGATAAPASVKPSVAPSVAPTVAATGRPTPPATSRPTPFPTAAFAALNDDPVPEEVASRFQAALAAMAGDRGMAATVMTLDGTWSGAAGKADGVHDMQPNSQFGIASNTKPIVAAQVMQLVEAGEISLDAPASDYLRADFTFDTNGATIRQLLSHRSGIPGFYTDDWEHRIVEERTRVWKVDEVLALLDPARRPVDGGFEYADTNYVVLGLVIEHVRQGPLVDVLRDGVLRVDGTERLIYQPAEAPTDPMAMPRGESRDALEQGGGYLPSISEASSIGAAGAMASDSVSLARWWRALCSGEIVSEASLTEMSTLYDGDIDYGLGLMNPADGHAQGVGHLGADFGYNLWSACLTEDHLIVVVLTNANSDIFNLGRPLVTAARSE